MLPRAQLRSRWSCSDTWEKETDREGEGEREREREREREKERGKYQTVEEKSRQLMSQPARTSVKMIPPYDCP